jgi:cobalt-zinc-cadmium efflux system protein
VLTLVIATGGLAINLVSVYLLEGEEMSLNERGAFYISWVTLAAQLQ